MECKNYLIDTTVKKKNLSNFRKVGVRAGLWRAGFKLVDGESKVGLGFCFERVHLGRGVEFVGKTQDL